MITVAAAPPRNRLFVATAISSLAALMFVGGLLAIWVLEREKWIAVAANGPWVPDDVHLPGVAANVMLITALTIPLFAQWAVSAARHGDRVQLGLSLGLVGILGLAIINAQVYVYTVIDLTVGSSGFAGMFYAATGAMVVMVIAGLIFTTVAAFRSFGGRETERELLASHALYWYVFAAAFSAFWLIVYVTK